MIKFFLIFLLLFSCRWLDAQNKSFSITLFDSLQNEPKKRFVFKENDSLSFFEKKQELMSHFQNKGYLYAYYYSENPYEVQLILKNRVLIDSCKFLIDTNENYYISNRNFSGKYYNEKRIHQFKKSIIKKRENIGYPFAAIETDSIIIDSKSASFILSLHKNNYILFDSLIILGNSKSKNKFLQAYLRIKPNEPYSEKRINAIDKKIKELGYISQSRPIDIWYSKEKSRITLYLKKTPQNKFSGILGILPPENNTAKTSITGDVSLNLVNSFKHADKFDFNWKKFDKYSQKLDASFTYPYILNFPVGIIGSLQINKKDTTYINTYLKGTLPYFFSGSSYAGIFYETRTSQILSKNLNSTTLSNSDIALTGIKLMLLNTDRPLLPRKGTVIKMDIAGGTKNSTIESVTEKYPYFEQNMIINTYLPINKILGFNSTIQSGLIKSKYLYANEMMKLGGFYSLKGFDEESISANQFVSANIELKAFFDEYSNTYLFFNTAYYKLNLNEYINDMPFGMGWGIDIETPAGIFSLAYAIGKQFDNPINLKNSKIHIALVNRF